jgi:hypothetical protein
LNAPARVPKNSATRRAYLFRFAAKNGHRLAVVALMVVLAPVVAG